MCVLLTFLNVKILESNHSLKSRKDFGIFGFPEVLSSEHMTDTQTCLKSERDGNVIGSLSPDHPAQCHGMAK